MTIAEIHALPIAKLADQNECHLFLWTTKDHLKYAWGIIESWGFDYKNILTWCKNPKGMIGFGKINGGTTEFVVYAQLGKNSMPKARTDRAWWNWPRSKHSAKPEAFQDIVESITPEPRLEMFARRKRLGWASWGNEIANDVEMPNDRS